MKATLEQVNKFQQFAIERVSNDSELTMDELYDQWRLENATDEERNADLLAVKAALIDMESGDTGQPFEEFDREFRARKGIPSNS